MRKEVFAWVFVLCFIILLSVGFVSAGWFSDFLDKLGITGSVVVPEYSGCTACVDAGNFWCAGTPGTLESYNDVCLDFADGGCEEVGGELVSINTSCGDYVAPEPAPSEITSCTECADSGYLWCLGTRSQVGSSCFDEEFGLSFSQSCESSGDIIVQDSSSCSIEPPAPKPEDFFKCETCTKEGFYWCSGNKSNVGESCGSSDSDGVFAEECFNNSDDIVASASFCSVELGDKNDSSNRPVQGRQQNTNTGAGNDFDDDVFEDEDEEEDEGLGIGWILAIAGGVLLLLVLILIAFLAYRKSVGAGGGSQQQGGMPPSSPGGLPGGGVGQQVVGQGGVQPQPVQGQQPPQQGANFGGRR